MSCNIYNFIISCKKIQTKLILNFAQTLHKFKFISSIGQDYLMEAAGIYTL